MAATGPFLSGDHRQCYVATRAKAIGPKLKMHKAKPKAKRPSAPLAASDWHITVQLDRETSERAGAGGTFQVITIEDDEGNNLTSWVDQGRHFHDLEELKRAIVEGFASRLTVTEGSV